MSRRSKFTILAMVCCFCVSCHVSKLASTTSVQNYVYTFNGFGAGPGSNILTFPVIGSEDKVISQAIVEGLAQFNLSIADYKLSEGLKIDVTYETDTSLMSAAMLSGYNQYALAQNRPDLKIEPGPSYGLQYKVKYNYRDRVISMQVNSCVLLRGLGSGSWYLYQRDYFGLFFSKQLGDDIHQKMLSITQKLNAAHG